MAQATADEFCPLGSFTPAERHGGTRRESVNDLSAGRVPRDKTHGTSDCVGRPGKV